MAANPLFPKAPRVEKAKRELSTQEQEGILFAFETLDADRQGYVTHKQLKVALRALGFGVRKADVLELLRRHGEEDSPRLNFHTFRELVADKLQERTMQDEYRRAFQLFDVLNQGAIDFPNLRKIVKSLNLEIADGELQDMINEFDTDKDGMISQEEFMAIMNASSD